MAANLQPPSKLEGRKSHHALAESMGMTEEYRYRHGRRNTVRIPQTCEGVR